MKPGTLWQTLFLNLKVGFYYLRSFLKKDWQLEDYPLEYNTYDLEKNQAIEAEFGKMHNYQPVLYSVRVIGWLLMFGHGNTKEEAYQKLVEQFSAYRASGSVLPRPGSASDPAAKIQFASADEMEKYDYLWDEFCQKILHMEPDDVYVSDGSTLEDFMFESLDDYYRRIALVYKLNKEDFESTTIVKILARIHQDRQKRFGGRA